MRLTPIIIALLLTPAVASAQTDIRLGDFAAFGEGGILIPDEDDFGLLAGDLGHVLGPKMLGPADTSGALGFDIGFAFSFSNIDEDSTRWQRALESGDSMLSTVQVQVRKGLPYSFELGGSVTHLLDSGLWGVGMQLKWAFLEGYKSVPDLALRAAISTVLGSRDLSMFISSIDLTVSKSFGVGGVLSLAPYAGYRTMIIRASSFVLGTFPEGSPTPAKFVIPSQVVPRFKRFFLGMRMIAVHTVVAFEAMIDFDGVQTFTTKIGADF